MDVALWVSLVGFVVAMSITPGPNNLMMMSSSALFGVRATLPHWFGVQLGFNLLLVASVFGLGELVARFPQSLWVVKAVGAVWLVWMASIFARAALNPQPLKTSSGNESRPLRLYEGALFQLINPKALLMTISAAGAYIALADGASARAVIMVATFVTFGAPCGLAWIMAGGVIHRVMADGRSARLLNGVIAGLLVLTIVLILAG